MLYVKSSDGVKGITSELQDHVFVIRYEVLLTEIELNEPTDEIWDALRLPFKVILEYRFINVQKENLKIIIKKAKSDRSKFCTHRGKDDLWRYPR